LCKTPGTIALLNEGGCGSCESCRLAARGNHPDLTVVDCSDKAAVTTEKIRELLGGIQLRPFLGGSRAIVFLDAEGLSVQASNILLKSLEEPTAGTYFILTASNPSQLPATLLSRCQIWFFDALSPEEIQAVLSGDSKLRPLAEQYTALTSLLGGTLELIEEVGADPERWLTAQTLTIECGRGSAEAFHTLVTSFGSKKELAATALHVFRVTAAAQMRSSSDPVTQQRWATFLTNTLSAERAIFERNLHPQYVFQVILMNLLSERASATAEGLLERVLPV
jgi:hypothetical protein